MRRQVSGSFLIYIIDNKITPLAGGKNQRSRIPNAAGSMTTRVQNAETINASPLTYMPE